MIPPAVFNLISKTSLKMLALIFRVEEKKNHSFYYNNHNAHNNIPSFKLLTAFHQKHKSQSLSGDCCGQAKFSCFFCSSGNLNWCIFPFLCWALCLWFLNSQAGFHQKFPGMGFMTLMPFGQNTESKFWSPPGQNRGEESAGTVSLSSGCQTRHQAAASMVLRMEHLRKAGKLLCWGAWAWGPRTHSGQVSFLDHSRGRYRKQVS